MDEGRIKKGGTNERPTTPRPAPPKGQGGYQPNKGSLNPTDPPRGGCGIPNQRRDKSMAATGNITMEVGHFYVKTFELQARMEACKARIEGMKAMNDLCRIKSEWPVYGQGDFNIIACELENLADELNAIWKKLTGKDADK